MEVEREVEENFARNAAELEATCRACFAAPSPTFEDCAWELIRTCAGLRDPDDLWQRPRLCARCARDLRAAHEFRRRCARSDELLAEKRRRVKEEPIETLEPLRFDSCETEAARDNDDCDEDKPERKVDAKRYECDACDRTYSHPKSLANHKKTHSAGGAFECERCLPAAAASFPTRRALAEHRRAAHGGGEKPRRYQCDLCGKAFTQRHILTTHRMTHTGERPHECDVCRRRFTQRVNLLKHARTHTGERPYACDACPKAFSQQSTLAHHRVTHTGARPYACAVCARAFSQQSSLAHHARTHTGERPHACPVCARAFARRAFLALHMRTHTGERPYQCDACSRAFAQQSSLACHMKTHARERKA